jgi:hypothetical protein
MNISRRLLGRLTLHAAQRVQLRVGAVTLLASRAPVSIKVFVCHVPCLLFR